MGRGPAPVREPDLNADAVEAWASEIRDYLLGRLTNRHRSVSLAAPHTEWISHAPIRRWWIFEGKRYASIGGTLSTRWAEVIRAARLLERTFNPCVKLSERPEGTIDWGQTLARGPFGLRAEYVLRSSAVGLGAEELAALRGWMQWIAAEWALYAKTFELSLPGEVQVVFEALAAQDSRTQATVEQLRRWVHVARRSRWPLLRDLVAETLRATLEADALDHIPLPPGRATLFELLCLVRIARRVAPPPDELRWLDPDLTGNKLKLAGATCWYQQAVDAATVLATPDFAHGLAEAASVFDLRVPKLIDLALNLNPPRRGISGLLVEAKSGSQGFDTAVAQLRVYCRARPRRPGERYLVWGVVENPEEGAITQAQLDWLRHKIEHGDGDVWVFSGVDSIDPVLDLLG